MKRKLEIYARIFSYGTPAIVILNTLAFSIASEWIILKFYVF
jgi:hypothetical protein